MNSNPDNSTPMLGEKFYDDSKLRKMKNFMTSSVILCLVISITALSISIVVLLKLKEPSLEDLTSDLDLRDRIQELDQVKEEVRTLQQKILQLENLLHEKESESNFPLLPLPDLVIDDIPEKAKSPEETSDMYFSEGSGDEAEDEEYKDDHFEGSADCPPFPIPNCPGNYEICSREGLCPVPFCCLKETSMHSHHHHH